MRCIADCLKAMHQQVKGLLWIVLAIVVGAVCSLGLPYLANLIPWSMEKRVSAYVNDRRLTACNTSLHPEAAVLFEKLVGQLYPIYPTDKKFPITIEVIPGLTVNAFASLGGHKHVYEGLIKQANSAEELAGVLAHEIEHVHHRDILQGLMLRLFTTEALRFILFNGRQVGPEVAGFAFAHEFQSGTGI